MIWCDLAQAQGLEERESVTMEAVMRHAARVRAEALPRAPGARAAEALGNAIGSLIASRAGGDGVGCDDAFDGSDLARDGWLRHIDALVDEVFRANSPVVVVDASPAVARTCPGACFLSQLALAAARLRSLDEV